MSNYDPQRKEATDTSTDDAIVPVHVTRFADPDAVETDVVDGRLQVTNRDALAEIDQVIGVVRETAQAYSPEDIIEPGDTLWHDRFATLEKGEAIDLDDLVDDDDDESAALVTDGGINQDATASDLSHTDPARVETELSGDAFDVTFDVDGEPTYASVLVIVDTFTEDGHRGEYAFVSIGFEIEGGRAQFHRIEARNRDHVPAWALAAAPVAAAELREGFVLDGVDDVERQLRDLFAGAGGDA